MYLLPKDDQDEKCVAYVNTLCYSSFLSLFGWRYKFLVVNFYCFKNLRVNIWKIFLCLEYRAKPLDYFRNLTYFHKISSIVEMSYMIDSMFKPVFCQQIKQCEIANAKILCTLYKMCTKYEELYHPKLLELYIYVLGKIQHPLSQILRNFTKLTPLLLNP